MKNALALALAPLLISAFVSTAMAADIKRGETLHNSQCIACHAARFGNNGADIYTRANRRVHDFAGLQRQVNMCKNNLQITWFDEDVADVVAYLNHQYYHFKQ